MKEWKCLRGREKSVPVHQPHQHRACYRQRFECDEMAPLELSHSHCHTVFRCEFRLNFKSTDETPSNALNGGTHDGYSNVRLTAKQAVSLSHHLLSIIK